MTFILFYFMFFSWAMLLFTQYFKNNLTQIKAVDTVLTVRMTRLPIGAIITGNSERLWVFSLNFAKQQLWWIFTSDDNEKKKEKRKGRQCMYIHIYLVSCSVIICWFGSLRCLKTSTLLTFACFVWSEKFFYFVRNSSVIFREK